jgi:hypothetical protein
VRDALYLVKLFWRDRYTSLLHEFFASADKKCANALLSTRGYRSPAFRRFFNFQRKGRILPAIESVWSVTLCDCACSEMPEAQMGSPLIEA